MDLRLERITDPNDSRLLGYCADHGPEHDASFLPGRDFALSADHAAYLLLRDDAPVGAVILIRTQRYRSVGKGRFSILHSVLGTEDAYSMLLSAIRPHFHDLRSVYMFVPDQKQGTAAILTKLGFHIERFSFVLQNDNPAPADVRFPDGYTVHHLEPSDSAGIREFVECANQVFSELAGHTDSSVDETRALFERQYYIEGGICLLRMGQETIGTACILKEVENPGAAEIGALGILKPHRRLGLGRTLLRYATSFAVRKGLCPVILSVNAENEKALSLYKSEGFVVTETMVCYTLDCG